MDELFSPQGTTFFCAGLGVAIAKGHTVIFQLEEAVVAHGDPENVRRQILQAHSDRSPRLHSARPTPAARPLPEYGHNNRCHATPAAVCHGKLWRALAPATGNCGVQAPALFRLLPSPARNEIVDVRMVGQVASPGVQHAHHPDLAANPTRLLCQLLGCRCRGFEEQIIEQALVRASDLIEASWQGEGEQEVGNRQEQILLLLQPALCIFVLAFGTMAVAAGMVTVLHLLTIRAAIDLPAQGWGATLFNRPHGLEVGGGHAAGILLAIGRTIRRKMSASSRATGWPPSHRSYGGSVLL